VGARRNPCLLAMWLPGMCLPAMWLLGMWLLGMLAVRELD
jgi:hypothetical protein